MSDEQNAQGPSDLGKAVIKPRKVTAWQPNWSWTRVPRKWC